MEAFHYQLDHLGTPQELTAHNGESAWSARYTAYGQAKIDKQTLTNPLRFQGQYFDPETGLHYNRHRYYTPDSGRYLTPDPVKLAGGLNSYRYVLNPTGWMDPLGLNGCPGGDGCKPAGGVEDPAKKARVDEGEPELPGTRPHSEKEAKAGVKVLEDRYNMHTIGKHSPDVPNKALKQRAIDGTDPITGKTPKKKQGNPSSKFNSWELQLSAIEQALSRQASGLSRFTGKDQHGNDIVRIDLPGAGKGYMPNSKDKNNPTFINLNRVKIKFDPVTGNPFTAFPIK